MGRLVLLAVLRRCQHCGLRGSGRVRLPRINDYAVVGGHHRGALLAPSGGRQRGRRGRVGKADDDRRRGSPSVRDSVRRLFLLRCGLAVAFTAGARRLRPRGEHSAHEAATAAALALPAATAIRGGGGRARFDSLRGTSRRGGRSGGEFLAGECRRSGEHGQHCGRQDEGLRRDSRVGVGRRCGQRQPGSRLHRLRSGVHRRSNTTAAMRMAAAQRRRGARVRGGQPGPSQRERPQPQPRAPRSDGTSAQEATATASRLSGVGVRRSMQQCVARRIPQRPADIDAAAAPQQRRTAQGTGTAAVTRTAKHSTAQPHSKRVREAQDKAHQDARFHSDCAVANCWELRRPRGALCHSLHRC